MANILQKMSLGVPDISLIKPLLNGLDQHPAIQLETATHTSLVAGLAEARYDCVLLPPWMAWSTFGVRFVPGIGVSAMESPCKECLYTRDDWHGLSRVYLNYQDEHWLPVMQLLFAGYAQSIPHFEIVEAPYWELEQGEGLFYGGEATTSDLNRFALTDLWRIEAGLPWVQYAWAARFQAPYQQLRTILTQARKSGLTALQETPDQFAPICHRVSYRLASLESEALHHLAGLAQQHEIAAPEGDITFC